MSNQHDLLVQHYNPVVIKGGPLDPARERKGGSDAKDAYDEALANAYDAETDDEFAIAAAKEGEVANLAVKQVYNADTDDEIVIATLASSTKIPTLYVDNVKSNDDSAAQLREAHDGVKDTFNTKCSKRVAGREQTPASKVRRVSARLATLAAAADVKPKEKKSKAKGKGN